MLFASTGSRGRLRLAVLVAVGAALFAVPSAGAGGQAGDSCPTGFDLGQQTITSAELLPRIAAGIAAAGSDSGFVAYFNSVDMNGDGVICAKTVPAGNGSGSVIWQYAYNFVDNNSSARTG